MIGKKMSVVVALGILILSSLTATNIHAQSSDKEAYDKVGDYIDKGDYQKNHERAVAEYKEIITKTNKAVDELLKALEPFDSYNEVFKSMPNDPTGYGIVDALIKLGVDYLSKGERKKAKLFFLAAIKERIASDQQRNWSHMSSPNWLIMIEKAYAQYGQGQKDEDLSKIKRYIRDIYGDKWSSPVWAWPPKAPGPDDPDYDYLRGFQIRATK